MGRFFGTTIERDGPGALSVADERGRGAAGAPVDERGCGGGAERRDPEGSGSGVGDTEEGPGAGRMIEGRACVRLRGTSRRGSGSGGGSDGDAADDELGGELPSIKVNKIVH